MEKKSIILKFYKMIRGGKDSFIISLAVMVFVVVFCNLLIPERFYFSYFNFTVTILGKYLAFCNFGFALDLVWGYLGF